MLEPAALQAAQLIDRLERLARGADTGGAVNPAQWTALRYLARANRFSRTPAALAEFMQSTRGTVSQTLIALEHKSLLTRTQNERDRRSIDLALTPNRIALMQSLPRLLQEIDEGAAREG